MNPRTKRLPTHFLFAFSFHFLFTAKRKPIFSRTRSLGSMGMARRREFLASVRGRALAVWLPAESVGTDGLPAARGIRTTNGSV